MKWIILQHIYIYRLFYSIWQKGTNFLKKELKNMKQNNLGTQITYKNTPKTNM